MDPTTLSAVVFALVWLGFYVISDSIVFSLLVAAFIVSGTTINFDELGSYEEPSATIVINGEVIEE